MTLNKSKVIGSASLAGASVSWEVHDLQKTRLIGSAFRAWIFVFREIMSSEPINVLSDLEFSLGADLQSMDNRFGVDLESVWGPFWGPFGVHVEI